MDIELSSLNCRDSNPSPISNRTGEKLLVVLFPVEDGERHGIGERRIGVIVPKPVTGDSVFEVSGSVTGVRGRRSGKTKGTESIVDCDTSEFCRVPGLRTEKVLLELVNFLLNSRSEGVGEVGEFGT